ncbi:hypothetical protein [Streptomyces sp. A1547]|uniref:hypothetical protein n=1 Tax=Streptomyces sp. A1547 TaxID=2563105 RepID=UPI00109ED3A5|nr:hypothetical protein [Streptomyces sp. A1547]THA30678.1 hypothetical protein E6W17_37385 [Streptomyces sp. A1547]
MSWVSTWWSARTDITKAGILTIVGLVIAGVFGLWNGVFSSKNDRQDAKPAPSVSGPHPGQPSSSPPPASPGQTLPDCGDTPGHDVTIEPKQLTVASEGSLTAEVTCNLKAGWHLTWMVQIDGVGKPVPHTNYYPKDDLYTPGPYNFDVHLSPSEPGSARTTYVVLMDDFSYRQLSENRNPDGSLLKLPNGARKVSNSVLVKRY